MGRVKFFCMFKSSHACVPIFTQPHVIKPIPSMHCFSSTICTPINICSFEWPYLLNLGGSQICCVCVCVWCLNWMIDELIYNITCGGASLISLEVAKRWLRFRIHFMRFCSYKPTIKFVFGVFFMC